MIILSLNIERAWRAAPCLVLGSASTKVVVRSNGNGSTISDHHHFIHNDGLDCQQTAAQRMMSDVLSFNVNMENIASRPEVYLRLAPV